jgi:acetyl-CoA acetyltransferase
VIAFAPPTLVAWLCFLSGGAYHYLGVRGRLSLAEAQRSRYQRAVHYITERVDGRYGLQTMCEGGGQSNATIIERL